MREHEGVPPGVPTNWTATVELSHAVERAGKTGEPLPNKFKALERNPNPPQKGTR